MVENVYHQRIRSLREPTLGQVVLANVLVNGPNAGTMIQYIGNDTKAVQFPHGNRKRAINHTTKHAHQL